MDLMAIVKELTEERDLVERAIISIERIALHRGKRRGRPPSWMTLLTDEVKAPKKRGRPPGKKRGAK
jgi:hypothetical protein